MSTKFISIRTAIGVKSNVPVRGITRRIGANTGSVIWYKIRLTGSLPLGEIHDMIARPKMARLNIQSKDCIMDATPANLTSQRL